MLAHKCRRRIISKVEILTNPPLLVDNRITLSISSSLSNRFKIQIQIQTRGTTKPPTKTKEDERSRTQGKHLNSTFVDLKRTIPCPDFSRSTAGTPSTTNMYFSESQFFINIFFSLDSKFGRAGQKISTQGTKQGMREADLADLQD
jgi:hypothetical protein